MHGAPCSADQNTRIVRLLYERAYIKGVLLQSVGERVEFIRKAHSQAINIAKKSLLAQGTQARKNERARLEQLKVYTTQNDRTSRDYAVQKSTIQRALTDIEFVLGPLQENEETEDYF